MELEGEVSGNGDESLFFVRGCASSSQLRILKSAS